MWPFVVSHYYTSFWWSPDFDDIAHRGMSGSYIIPVVGWYDDLDDVRIDRIGGPTALSLTHCASGNDRQLRLAGSWFRRE